MVATEWYHYTNSTTAAHTDEWTSNTYVANWWVDTKDDISFDRPIIDSQVLEGWDPDENKYGG